MSLTGLLDKNKEFKNFFNNIKPTKNMFLTLSEKNPFSNEYEEKCPYNLSNPYYSTLIGTAFDYLARFEVARNINENKEKSYEMLIHGIPKSGLHKIYFTSDFNIIKEKTKEEFDNSIEIFKAYVNREIDEYNLLLEKVLYFARLEHFYRVGNSGTWNYFKDRNIKPTFIKLKHDDFRKERLKSNLIGKNFIEVNGLYAKMDIYFKNFEVCNVKVCITSYDENKKEIEEIEFNYEFDRSEFVLNEKACFIKIKLIFNEKKDVENVFMVDIKYITKKQYEDTIDLLFKFDIEMVDELENLFITYKEYFIKDIVKPDSEVVFNPEFGVGSELVGGADADIFIDGVLYDFKTTKKNGYVGKDASQIIGYYLLNKIAKKHIEKRVLFYNKEYIETVSPLANKKIHKLAFYKARFGEVEYVDIDSIFNKNNEKKILNEFEEVLKKINSRYNDIVKNNFYI